jgi:lysophospholipid acyltransferase
MVLVMKLSAFCWNVWDGKQKDADLSPDQQSRAVRKLPSILNYAGFVAFFPSVMIGPAFDYADYERWINTSMFDLPPGTDPLKAPPTRKKRKIPRSGTPATIKMLIGLAWTIAFLQLSAYYSPTVVLSKRFENMGFLFRIYHLHMMNLVERMKYYGVWTLTEGACILAGIGYRGINPKTGKPDWDRLTNIKPLGVELAQNSHAYLANWNCNTNQWLRNYVYLRVTPKGKKPGFRASMATFVTSAFWHGFEPGYYMAFVFASFIQNVAKSRLCFPSLNPFPFQQITDIKFPDSRRLIRPFFLSPDGSKPTAYKRYYDIFTCIITHLVFDFTTTPFILLSVSSTLHVWRQLYFYPIIGVLACSIFLASPGKKLLAKRVRAYTGASSSSSSRPGIKRNESMESLQGATMGIPVDPERELDELVEEVLEELRRRTGQMEIRVDAPEVKKLVQEKLLLRKASSDAVAPRAAEEKKSL